MTNILALITTAAITIGAAFPTTASISLDDNILINKPDVHAFEVAIVEDGCTEPGKPVKERSSKVDASINQCKTPDPDDAPIPNEMKMADTHITICWRDNYVEASPVDCVTL